MDTNNLPTQAVIDFLTHKQDQANRKFWAVTAIIFGAGLAYLALHPAVTIVAAVAGVQ